MKYSKFFLLFVVLLSSLFTGFAEDTLTIHSPFYFGEQKNTLKDIHYLENEMLSFTFCGDENAEKISFSLSCGEEKIELDIYADTQTKGCYFTNYNLKQSSCNDPLLKVSSTVNNKEKIEKRQFVKEKESKIINEVLEKNKNLLSSVDLSYYLLVLANIEGTESKNAQETYDKLKDKRNNDNKCWPSSDCDLADTTTILKNLHLAGYAEETRLLQDGRIYLETNIIKHFNIEGTTTTIFSDSYELEIRVNDTFSSDIECDLTLDNDDEDTYEFTSSDDFEELRVEDKFENNFELDCDAEIDEILVRTFEEKIEDESYSTDDKITYDIPGSDLDDFSTFNFEIRIEHSFGSSDVDCDLTIDGDADESYSFDNTSTRDEMTINKEFDEDMEFDCDDDLDDIYLYVYAGDYDENTYTDTDNIDYELSSSATDDVFDFEIKFDYSFDSSSEKLECELDYDEKTKKYTFDQGDILIVEDKQAGSSIAFTCEDKNLNEVTIKVFDIFARAQINEKKADVSTFSVSIPADFSEYNCIGESLECDFETTLNALTVYEGSIENSANLDKYVSSLVQEEENTEFKRIIEGDTIGNSANFVFYKSDDDVLDFLKFEQNNDGSWEDGADTDQILPSSLATIALNERDSGSEYVDDGEKWIYYSEPGGGWGSIEKNSIAFYAIKDQLVPYITLDDNTIIRQTTQFSMHNPTIYDLRNVKLVLSEEISGHTSYLESLGDLESEQVINFNVTVTKDFYGKKSGTLTLSGIDGKDTEVTLLEIPILVTGPQPFTILNQTALISRDLPNLELGVTSLIPEFDVSCSYINPFTSQKTEVKISKSTKTISIPNPEALEKSFDFTLTCTFEGVPFDQSVKGSSKIVNISFTSETNSLNISYAEFSIFVTNTLDEPQNIDIEIVGDYTGLIIPAETDKLIAPQDTRELFFIVQNPEFLTALGNTSTGAILVSSPSGYKKEIALAAPKGVVDTGGGGGISFWLIFFLVIVFGIGGLAIYRWIELKKFEQEEQNNQENEDEIYMDDNFK